MGASDEFAADAEQINWKNDREYEPGTEYDNPTAVTAEHWT